MILYHVVTNARFFLEAKRQLGRRKEGWHYSQLHYPVDNGYLAEVTLLLRAFDENDFEGREIDRKDHVIMTDNSRNEMTALQKAAEKGHVEIAQVLINAGASLWRKDNRGTALHISAEQGSVDMVDCLIRAGADINEKTHEGRTALHLAVIRKKMNILEYLIAAGIDVNAKCTKIGNTALYIAVCKVQVDFIESLINAEADVNARNTGYRTALHETAAHGHLEIAKRLMNAGADVNVLDIDNRTALHYAAEALSSMKHRNPDLVKHLINAGTDVNVKENSFHQRSALHYVVCANVFQDGNLEIIKSLLTAGALVNASRRPHNSRPLDDLIQKFVHFGIDFPEFRESVQISEHHYELIAYLLSSGAFLSLESESGISMMIGADKVKGRQVVEVLRRIPMQQIESGSRYSEGSIYRYKYVGSYLYRIFL